MFNEDKIILDLCGGTGSWSKPYKENGYDVRVIDPQEWLEDDYGTGDVRLFKKPKEALLEGLSVVDGCLRIILITNPSFWVLENPVGRLRHYIGKPKCTFQPYQYGDNYSKRTCLWGNFNMPEPTDVVEPEMVEFISKKGVKKRMSKNYYEAFKLPVNERARLRSMTSPGFAKAFYEKNR